MGNKKGGSRKKRTLKKIQKGGGSKRGFPISEYTRLRVARHFEKPKIKKREEKITKSFKRGTEL